MKYILYILAAAIAVIGFTVFQSQAIFNTQKSSIRSSSPFAGADIGGPFRLQSQSSITVTEKDFPNDFKLIYFGFTYCPSICPTELQKMAEAYNTLPRKIQNDLQMMFISVDPQRDTVNVMREYVPLFHSELIGLTGSVEAVSQAMNNFRVYAAKVPSQNGAADEYSVDHSSFIYLMSPDNILLDVFKIETSAEKMRSEIERIYHSY